MISYKNLIIIGTSHISIESVKKVEKLILGRKPEIVALELDPSRYHALLSKAPHAKPSLKDIREVGIKGSLFNLIGGYIEKKLGKLVNTPPGSEMKKAIESARAVKSDIVLIDQDIRVTLKKLSKSITWKEKWSFVADLIKFGIFKQKTTIKKLDLRKVPNKKIVNWLTKNLKERYPNIHKILITERDHVMAKNLVEIMKTNKSIIAVVGLGHEEGTIKYIKQQK